MGCLGNLSPRPKVLMGFFIGCNLINYLDRGIIPGAPSEIDNFISGAREFDDDMDDVDLYLGITQSMFIVGFSIAAILFGNLVHKVPPFRLVGIGLSIWIVSVFGAGLSKYANSYVALVVARMVSGVGEASFQVVAAPYIQDNAGDQQGFWLGLFYTAIPFGTCLGYGYGAILASSPLGWPAAFFIEGILMAPLALFCFMLSDTAHLSPIDDPERETTLGDSLLDASHKGDPEPPVERRDSIGSTHSIEPNNVTIWDEVKACLKHPLFVWSALGYAGYSGGLIGFSTFGPAFVMALGYFNTEYAASMVFGVLLAFAGLLGTPIGGIISDRLTSAFVARGRPEIEAAAAQSFVLNLSGTIVAGVCVFAQPAWLFMTSICLGALLMFASTASMNLAILQSVDHENRPFAVAFATLIMHALGDVPSPVVVGDLKDQLAPHCTPKSDDGSDDVYIPDNCDHQQTQLRLVIFVIICWLLCSPLSYLITFMWSRAYPRYHNRPSLSDDLK